MDAFGGFEPRVGEIRALRTFRIGPGGILYPLFGTEAWTSATNTSGCRVRPTGTDDGTPHSAPDPECGCGFYAYAEDTSAAEYPQSQHVLAVVACWGRVIAGTRGVRAQHARIEALWMSPRVPSELRSAVAAQYPATSIYEAKTAMLAEHPPTHLECYEIPTAGQRRMGKRALTAALVTALAVGALPANWTWYQDDLRLIWVAELGFFLLAAIFYRLAGKDRQARGTALLYVAVALWLIAPFAGGVGIVLLRLPILQIAVLGYVHRARLNREANRFPASITAA